METKLLTAQEVSQLTRLSLATVRFYLWTGKIPTTRLGRRTLVRSDLLAKWIDNNTKPAKNEAETW